MRGRHAGLARGVVDPGDVFRNLAGAARGFGDIAGDFLRGGALFLDGGGDRAGDFADLAMVAVMPAMARRKTASRPG